MGARKALPPVAWLLVGLLAPCALHAEPPAIPADCGKLARQIRERFQKRLRSENLEDFHDERSAARACEWSSKQMDPEACARSWVMLRKARDEYIESLRATCVESQRRAAACRSQANSQACLAEVAAYSAAENEEAARALDEAIARADEVRRKAAQLAGTMSEEEGKIRFLQPPPPGSPPGTVSYYQSLSPAARAEAERFVTRTKLEQTNLVAATTAFREVATAEVQNRRSSGSTLTGLRNDAYERDARMGSVGGGSGVGPAGQAGKGPATGGEDSFWKDVKVPAIGSLPGMPASGTGAGTAVVLPGGRTVTAAPALPVTGATQAGTAANPKAATDAGGKVTAALTRNPGKDKDDRATSGTAFRSGDTGSLSGGEDVFVSGLAPAGKVTLRSARGAGEARARMAENGQPETEKADSESKRPPGDVAETAGGVKSFSDTGQLGPATMHTDKEFFHDELMSMLAEEPLTEEEKAWLAGTEIAVDVGGGRAPASTVEALVKHFRETVKNGGVARADSPSLFARVRQEHARAQKKGLVARMLRKL